jgi:hypothetical protein
MGDSTNTLAEAPPLYDRWMQDPRVALAPEPRGAETMFRHALTPFASQLATKAVADCYLIGFAEAAGAYLVTFDKGLAATAQHRQVPVALLEPVESAASIVPPANQDTRSAGHQQSSGCLRSDPVASSGGWCCESAPDAWTTSEASSGPKVRIRVRRPNPTISSVPRGESSRGDQNSGVIVGCSRDISGSLGTACG